MWEWTGSLEQKSFGRSGRAHMLPIKYENNNYSKIKYKNLKVNKLLKIILTFETDDAYLI